MIPGETPEGRKRRLRGSKRGALLVEEAFADAVTRKRFCELVGIHPTTLRRWESLGVVEPTRATIMNSQTMIFSDEEIEVGRRVVILVAAAPGKLSALEAARQARSELGTQ